MRATPKNRRLGRPHWGLRLATDAHAAAAERRWRLPVVAALAVTVPAFYAELLEAQAPLLAMLAYLLAALVVAASLAHTAWRSLRPARHLAANGADAVLVLGLLIAAAIPASQQSPLSLLLRLLVSVLSLVRMLWAMQGLIVRGGVTYLLLLSLGVLALCGAGFWWLEPRTPTFADGLWLAFTTAATVGYGDVVPTTPASKIFAVFVVLLGFGVLTMVTAAIAATWIESEERQIEREILRDMRYQIDKLHAEILALRAESRSATRLLASGAIGHAEHPHEHPPTPPG
ncbi:MAG: potassium channel family protein [Rubrivivax sp.]